MVRIVRVVLIAVAAGGLAVGGFDLTPVLFALPGPLLFIAALDLIEPLAQESDHPTRRLLLPLHRRGADPPPPLARRPPRWRSSW